MTYNWIGCRRYSWCPEDQKGRDHLLLSQWLQENLGPIAGGQWLRWLDHRMEALPKRSASLGPAFSSELLLRICRQDIPELVALLFPLCPQLFLQPLSHLSHWGCSYPRFHSVDLCAYYGSPAALESLLELGADPNGLDRLEAARCASHVDLEGRIFFFQPTPLDLARVPVPDPGQRARMEDCRLLLALYGGVSTEELFSIPPGTLPPRLPTPDWTPDTAYQDWRTWPIPPEDGA